MNLSEISQVDLEIEIIREPSLYAMFDECRLMDGGYSLEQMREVAQRWIEEGDECA